METLLVSTGVVALAEIGDKTQLLTLMLATQLRRPVAIILGILLATLANHTAAAWLGMAVAAWLASDHFYVAIGHCQRKPLMPASAALTSLGLGIKWQFAWHGPSRARLTTAKTHQMRLPDQFSLTMPNLRPRSNSSCTGSFSESLVGFDISFRTKHLEHLESYGGINIPLHKFVEKFRKRAFS